MIIGKQLPFVLVLFLLLHSCEPTHVPKSRFEGTWHNTGYGISLHITAHHYTFYDRTTISCTKKHQGSLEELLPFLVKTSDTLILSKGTSTYRFLPAEAPSQGCSAKVRETGSNNVLYNFDVFAETLNDHFVYFEMQGINPGELFKSARSRLEIDPTEQQLYLIMQKILDTLNDNHGYLEAPEALLPEASSFENATGDQEEPSYGDFQVADRVSDVYIDREYTRGTRIMRWGTLNDSLGYLQIKAMWLFADLELQDRIVKEEGYVGAYIHAMGELYEGTYIERERSAVALLLDTVMADLMHTKAMIVDIRFNGGGQDVVSMELLKRFNEKYRPVARKKARFRNTFTDRQTLFLEAGDQAYLNPVFLLTSRQSASAADFLALAALELPHITRVGTPTQGALSDALEKTLPNQWQFALSNELYTDLNGNVYEYKGIAPDIPVNYPEDRQDFFRLLMENPENDKAIILNAVSNALLENPFPLN